MRHVRVPRWLPPLCVGAALLAAGPASGRPGDGIRFGGLTLSPYAGIDYVYDDDVYRQSADEASRTTAISPEDEAAGVTVFIPQPVPRGQEVDVNADRPSGADTRYEYRLGISGTEKLKGDRGALSLDAYLGANRHLDYDTEDSEHYGFRIGLRYQTPRDLSIFADNSLSVNTGAEDAVTSEQIERKSNTLRGGVGWAVGPKTSLEFDSSWRTDVSDREDVTTADDFDVGATAYYSVTGKSSIFAGYRYGWTVRDTGTNTTFRGDATTQELDFGATGRFTQKLSGRASIGYTSREYDTADVTPDALNANQAAYIAQEGVAAEDVEVDDKTAGWVANVGLVQRFGDRTSLSLSAHRDLDESTYSGDNSYFSTGADLLLSHSLPVGLTLTASVGWEQLDYDQPFLVDDPENPGRQELKSRADNEYSFRVGAGYDITRWLSANAGATTTTHKSDFEGADYETFTVSVGLMARY